MDIINIKRSRETWHFALLPHHALSKADIMSCFPYRRYSFA